MSKIKPKFLIIAYENYIDVYYTTANPFTSLQQLITIITFAKHD